MTEDDIAKLKTEAFDTVDANADKISRISEHIMNHPESGFREYETSAFIQDTFNELGIEFESGLALTGVKGRMRSRSSGPTVCVIGEMDSLIIPEHPFADPSTGAAHACGHNAQVASMIGVGIALRDVLCHLGGNVVLMAVPAEEGIELGWRKSLRDSGQIEFLVGKAELLRIGAFNDVDMAMLTHTGHGGGFLASVGDSHNGCIFKNVTYNGVSAHAGAFPSQGVNALKAAYLGLTGIDVQRETLRDEDAVRIHPIITHGGDAVSAVPSRVSIEMMVRAKTIEAIADASGKVDRALHAGAMALGASVTIETTGGYMPHLQDDGLVEIMRQNCELVVGVENVVPGKHVSGSTDMGDLSMVMPVVHPRSSGTVGNPHSSDYYVRDHVKAAVLPAKFMAGAVIDLLANDATSAKVIVDRSKASMSVDDYIGARRDWDRVDIF